MKVQAPGKLILSGEHAVVYGHPAIAMAVNRYVTATASPQLLPFISFDLSDLDYRKRFTLNALDAIKNRIKRKYQRFVKGEYAIRDVLHKPVELAQVAFSLFFEVFNISLTQGIKIHIQSTIPIGCGLGSSAATILSIVTAIAKHLQIDISPETYLRLGLEAENMQHGYSSGLDLKVSLHGGCVYAHEGLLTQRAIPTMSLYLVNTGIPKTSTGECVEYVAKHFQQSSLGLDFAAVTMAMDAALVANEMQALQAAVMANHDLLTHIGVVPLRVQAFIRDIQAFGGAAKICGAGAVAGDKAGAVLVVTDQAAELAALCLRYDYNLLAITGESRGVHVI